MLVSQGLYSALFVNDKKMLTEERLFPTMLAQSRGNLLTLPSVPLVCWVGQREGELRGDFVYSYCSRERDVHAGSVNKLPVSA